MHNSPLKVVMVHGRKDWWHANRVIEGHYFNAYGTTQKEAAIKLNMEIAAYKRELQPSLFV